MRTPIQKLEAIQKQDFAKCHKCDRRVNMNRNKNKIIVADKKYKNAIVYCSRTCWLHRKER